MIRAKALLLAAVLALAGCAGPTIVYECATLPIPEPAPLPVVQAERFIDLTGEEAADELRELLPAAPMVCVDERGYEDLAVRETMRRGYSDQLRRIMQAHNESIE